MDLEQRLRSELDRSGRNAAVSSAPPIEELAAVARTRHQRNRLMGAVAALAIIGVIGIGAIVSTQGGGSSLEVAAGGADQAVDSADESAAEVDDDQPVEAQQSAAEAESAETVEDAVDAAQALNAGPEEGSDEDELTGDASVSVTSSSVDTSAAEIVGVSRSLQVDQSSVEVERRSSAVALAAGSGVLVVPDGAGGYGGLATRFGSQTSVIGLSSGNGLDWTEVALSGVPDGATPSLLVDHDGVFVALFESFDSETGRATFVGTSSDLATWDVSTPLSGDPFATGLAVGDAGVIILGDNSAPDVWIGPIGGPYERTARLAATAVTGVTTLGNEFLVAGRSSQGATLFRSSDGIEWTGAALSSPSVPGSAPIVSVDGGAIILSNVATGGNVSLISTDGGETWSQLNADSDGVSVSSSTLGLLSVSSNGAAVAIADDESFAAARIDVEAPDRLSLVAAGNDEVVLLQATETGANWIVASR